jgi:uncharacterized protein (DUF362 family)
MAKVFLAGVRKGSSEKLVREAVRASAEATTDFSWLSRGDSVFIKPALNSGNNYPATTSPVGIRAIVELLRDRGAGRIVLGDMSGVEHLKFRPDGTSGSTRSLMERCGMAQAALEAGAELHFFEESDWGAFYEDLPPSGSHWTKGLMMPMILKEMDHIVLMPRCARHALAGSTLGLKAVVGYWRTDTRLEYHKASESLYEKTAEGNAVESLITKQRLVISVANKILTTYGPDKGYVLEPETGLVIASESVVAHDMVSLAWLLLGRLQTPKWQLVWFNDPDKSQFIVNMANRWIVSMLGNIVDAFQSDTLIKNDIKTIWEDRTLNRAYQLFGGRPVIDLKAANDLVPGELKKSLTDMTTFGS